MTLPPDHARSATRYARIAGAGYLVIIVCGIYAEFFVRSSLIVAGDAGATAANIAASEVFFRSSIAAELVMLVADVMVAVSLYMVFRAVSEGLAMMAAFFRLAHAAVVGTNLLNVYVPLLLIGEAGLATATDGTTGQLLALVLLDAHGYGYALGLVFFGVYCALLGTLILRSRYVPRVLGALLLMAAAGYVVDTFARTMLLHYEEMEVVFGMVVLLPAFVAELSFTLWLLVKGVDVPTEEAAS